MNTKIKLIALFYLLTTCIIAFANCDKYESGQVLIKMKANKTKAQKTSLKSEMQAISLKTFSSIGVELWDVSANSKNGSINHIIAQYRNHPDIEYIEPNYVYELSLGKDSEDNTRTNKTQSGTLDPLYNNQWYLDNYGQNGGTSDVDINAPEAWNIISESPTVKVGVMDTGIDWAHIDLVNNIWQNLDEDADGDGQVLVYQNGEWIFDPGDENGIDDDGNGYIDDFIGWDFMNDDNNPYDGNSHGTHVAGIIGAGANNGEGIAGVSWNIQLIGLKMITDDNQTNCSSVIEAIEYMDTMNIPISNNSWAFYCENETHSIFDAIENAKFNGHLFVAAAGNSAGDNDADDPIHPASYPLDNIISVANIGNTGHLSNFSNYGASSVDIAAPGELIWSAIPNNDYALKHGTSQSAPQVTAACALLWQLYPDYTYLQIKDRLINTATTSNELNGKCVSNGRLNLYAMLSEAAPPTCIRVNDSLALVKLYESTKGDNWINSWNLNQSMNSWYGVTLNASDCVSSLNLVSNNLSGVIPPEIEQLDNLVDLNLSGNNLYGNLPPEIGNLERLKFLHLANNNLVGYLPTSLQNLTLLETLRLQNNQFIGGMPLELTALNNLTTLNLTNNKLQGCYTTNLKSNNWCSRFNSSHISNGNNFNESWSNFCSFNDGICNGNGPCHSTDRDALISLYNSTNGANWTNTWNLNEPIDNWHGVILNSNGCVEKLLLGNNNLSGSISAGIGNLNNLEELQLWGNQLTGGIPPQIGDLFYLKKLVIVSKLPPAPQLGGAIPTEIGNLKNLEMLFLHSNNLTGTIPPEIGNLTNLKRLDLYNNALGGNIPPEIGNLIHCEDLSLAINKLVGSIPDEIGQLTKLTNLQLYDNLLSGTIPPGFGDQESLVTFALNNNMLSGEIPPELGQLVNIVNMSLDYNQLTGSIPKELGYLPELGYINLCHNNLIGCYESTLSNWCDINACVSDGNNFSILWSSFCNSGAGTCDRVWPGDFNTDGVADDADALYWGLAYGFTGAPRSNASSDWVGQHAPIDWSDNVYDINSKHQDGDGNGIVNDADLQVLSANIGETNHLNSTLSLPNLTKLRFEEFIHNGVDDIYDIYVDDENGNPAIIHGCSFSIQYEHLAGVSLITANSSLNPSHVFIESTPDNDKFYFALTRTDKVDQPCNGPVARIIVAVEDEIPTGDPKVWNITESTIDTDNNLSRQYSTIYDPVTGSTLGANLELAANVIHSTCTKFGSAKVRVYGNTGPYRYYWNTGETTAQINQLTPGTYRVQVTNRFNETKVLAIEIDGQVLPQYDEDGNLMNCIIDNCPTLFSPIHNVPSGTYTAGRTLKSNDYIGTGKQVEFRGQERIRLDSGFKVRSNVTRFSAKIGDCQ